MNALSESDLIAELGWLNRLARSLVRDPATADDLAQDTVEAALANPPGNLGSGIRPW
nr:RNA polymerase sigma factor [Planctomycetota bacterium]